ncbi:S-layer homology domain-containing protein [Paenibacillus sp. 1P07SE]|uniref:S-layer homology domain-containing protein n=1 Tax=Paenibacillus sp. 1P07SE TaxID=3132209 RepID=UPI0039A6D12B
MRMRAWYKAICLTIAITMTAITVPYAAAEQLQAYTFEEVFGELLDTHGELITSEDMYDTFDKSGKVSVVDLDYEGTTQKGLYAEVDDLGDARWSTQSFLDLAGPIHEGDVIFIAYKLRGIESLDEANEVTVSDKVRPSPSRPGRSVGVDATVIADGEWNQIFGGVVATWDTQEGETPQFVIHMAYELQKLEITDIQIINFRQHIDVSQLPQMDREITYEGREADAPWRAAAAQRIEDIRKSDVVVKVVDDNGAPLSGAEVAVRQKRHAYSFGSIMNFNVIDSDRSQALKDQYLDLIRMTSNSSGETNNLKWHRIYEMEDNIERNLSWAEENELKMRGHVLIWGQWSKPPAHLVAEMQSDPELLRQRTLEHITTAVTKYKGRLEAWDVVNEPLSSQDFTNVLGNEVMLEWFAAAHQADPDARLFLNDYGLLTNDVGHGNYTYNLLEYLVDNEADIHGLGMQGHFSGRNPVAPVKMLEILDRFGGLGLDIEVTEFTFDTLDEQLQADFWRDVLTVMFSHPSTTGFHTWGLWEGQMDKSGSAMFRQDFSIKPNGEVWMDLIYNQWWTDEAGTTDQHGEFHTRAFHGEHEVTVTHNGEEVTADLVLDADGAELIVALETAGEANQPPSGWYGGGYVPVVAEDKEEEMEEDAEQTADPEPSAVDPAGEPEPSGGPAAFGDTDGHWAAREIARLVELGAISGYPDGTFRPDRDITRAEFAKLLALVFGLDVKPGHTFSDTSQHWARDYIAAAYESGIVEGYGAGSFGPDDRITREQLAVMLMRAASLGSSGADAAFADTQELSSWAAEAVAAAQHHAVISGYPDGSFRPRQPATRAEAATMIVNAGSLG